MEAPATVYVCVQMPKECVCEKNTMCMRPAVDSGSSAKKDYALVESLNLTKKNEIQEKARKRQV